MQYTVAKGDNLITIAKKHNTSLSEIMQLNDIKNPNLLAVGQVLQLPEPDDFMLPASNSLTRENFQAKVETFINFLEGKKLQRQLDMQSRANIIQILEVALECGVVELKEIAYVLATIHWETNRTYKPLEEYKKGAGKPYGIPYKGTGKVYYGRGYVQLTWYDNYVRFTKILMRLGYNVDLVNHPEQACIPEIAAKIAIIGMRDGSFTGRCLDDYFNPMKSDWFNARQIINGKDRAVIIADIAKEIYYIIK